MIQSAVILLVFANDVNQSLNELAKELEALRALLQHKLDQVVDDRGKLQFKIVALAYSTMDTLFEELRIYRNRIVILHFAGHTNSSLWQLSDDTLSASGIANILRLQKSLKFLFLNGCQNQAQVELFANAGIPAMTVTSVLIEDVQARKFSTRFYQHLISNHLETNLQDAFDLAKAEILEKVNHKKRYRTLRYKKPVTNWAWALIENAEKAGAWSLNQLLKEECFGLPELPMQNNLPTQPFKNIHHFTKKDAPIFFGRCTDILRVFQQLTLSHYQHECIYLLYGHAGVGKSSFLAAGLFFMLSRASSKIATNFLILIS